MLKLFRKKPQKTEIHSLSNINGLVREGNDYLSDKVIFLDQKLMGNLFCSEEIFIEKDGDLAGNICGKHCVISGTVSGNISTTELLEITKTAVIRGKIRATDICIEPGAVVNGAITIAEDKSSAVTLANRIKKHTPEKYAELRALDEHSKDETLNKPTQAIEVKKAEAIQPPALVSRPEMKTPPNTEPEKIKEPELPKKEDKRLKAAVPPVPAAEQIIQEEPETKLAPARKAPEPKKDDTIQRWW